MKRNLVLVALVPALAMLVAGTARAAAASDPGAGAGLVAGNGCSGCHGADLHGGTGPKLYGIEHRRSAAQIANAIADPKAPMPKFPLTGAQIGDIVAYLSSLDGGGGRPVATLSPAKPSGSATLTVRFTGTPPAHVEAVPSMQMGGSAMHDAKVTLKATSDPHVWKGTVSFSMAGAWTIDVTYDGKHLTVPVDVAGSM